MGRGAMAGTRSRKSSSAGVLSKPVKCYLCPSEFSRKGDLRRHELTHTGVKNYACTVCKKRFSQASGLKTHTNVHTGDKPYRCAFPGCGAEFGDPSSNARHKKETHLVDYRYECPFERCNSAIKRRSAFAQHLSKKHNKNASSEELDALKKAFRSPTHRQTKSRQSTLVHSVTSPPSPPVGNLLTLGTPALDDNKAVTEYIYPDFSHRDITEPLPLPTWSSSTVSSFSTQSSTETLVDEMINFVDTKAYYSDMTGPVQMGMIPSSNHSPSPSSSPFGESDLHYPPTPLSVQDLQRMNSILAYDRQRYMTPTDQSRFVYRYEEDIYSPLQAKVLEYSTPDALSASPSATQQNLAQQWGSWGFA